MNILGSMYYRTGKTSCLARLRQLEQELPASRSHQGQLLRAHLEYCKAHVPMYRTLSLDDDDAFGSLSRVPIFDKEHVNADTPDAISCVHRSGRRVDSTSGTSGQSFHFLLDREEKSIRKAYELLANRLLGLEPGMSYLQIWGGHESLGLWNRCFVRAYDFVSGRRLETVKAADARNLSSCLDLVRQYAKSVLITYPAILHGLCRLGLSDVLATYKAIILTGEAVDYGEFSEFGLRDNLRNRYGSREFGVIAIADSGSLRYFPSRFVLEVHSERGLLVTDMAKQTMPMLRYPIGDYVDVGSRHANALDAIERLSHLGRVNGRVLDVLQGKTGTQYVGTFWTLLFRKELKVDKFRLVLRPGHQLEVHYVGRLAPHDVRNRLLGHLGEDFCLHVRQRSAIPELANSKQRIVERCTQEGMRQSFADVSA